MKKLLTKILIGVLAVATMLGCFAGCSNSSWIGPTMTDSGASGVNIVGGFIGEKGNYYYYINGVGTSSSDNEFGVPVKGSLMVADKNDLTKTEVVVPKIFAASDYKAGLYIFGDYVYYGTPNTDKTSSGEIANTELTFMKTKLDGTDTVKFFTLPSLTAEYRMVEYGGVVYIVYYDSEETALKSFNCADLTTTVIAKTDAKVSGANGESLKAYKFAENGNENKVVVYYTTTVYAEEYNENKTEDRASASYNKLYAYGYDEGQFKNIAILDGSKMEDMKTERTNPATYEIKMAVSDNMYYTETINGTATTYAYGVGKVTNETALADTSLIISNVEVYTVTEGLITKTALTGNYNAATVNVAKDTAASALLAVNGDYIYFTDENSGVSRIKMNEADAKVQKVSEDSVYTTWYPIQFIGDNMFYCDNSAIGASYIKYVNVGAGATINEEDTDDDGTADKFYLQGHKSIGIITDEDEVSIANARVNAIANGLDNGALKFTTDENGKLYVKAVNDAKAAVDGVIAKELEISEDTTALLNKYVKAVEMANNYNRLNGINVGGSEALQNAYNEIKSVVETFRASSDYTEISGYIGNNLLWNYQQAQKLYEQK